MLLLSLRACPCWQTPAAPAQLRSPCDYLRPACRASAPHHACLLTSWLGVSCSGLVSHPGLPQQVVALTSTPRSTTAATAGPVPTSAGLPFSMQAAHAVVGNLQPHPNLSAFVTLSGALSAVPPAQHLGAQQNASQQRAAPREDGTSRGADSMLVDAPPSSSVAAAVAGPSSPLPAEQHRTAAAQRHCRQHPAAAAVPLPHMPRVRSRAQSATVRCKRALLPAWQHLRATSAALIAS